MGEALGDRVVLMVAEQDGEPVAGALNLLGREALYGRNWGCVVDAPFLHFELCYYRAIDFAIEHGLPRVEAGAQGEHKIQRGYLPAPTYSAHWIAASRPAPRGRRLPGAGAAGDAAGDGGAGRALAVQAGGRGGVEQIADGRDAREPEPPSNNRHQRMAFMQARHPLVRRLPARDQAGFTPQNAKISEIGSVMVFR